MQTSALAFSLSREARKERQDAIELKVFVRMKADFGWKPSTPEDKAMQKASYERHLSREKCPPERYTEVYELAVSIYRATDAGKGPFNVIHLLKAWAQIQEKEQYDLKHAPLPPERGLPEYKHRCIVCGGSRIHMMNGRIVYTTVDGRRFPAKCPTCRETNDGEQTEQEA
jgi:hypothetical protein